MNYLIRNEVLVSHKDIKSIIERMIEEGVIKVGDGGKVYAIFKYLYKYTTRAKTVETSLKALVIGCGYKPRGGKSGINNQFKDILEYLDNYGYLGVNDYDFSSIGLNDLLSIPIDNLLDVDENNDYKNFVVLEAHEEEVIRGIEGVDNNLLEAYFLVIKARINNNEDKLQVSYASVELMASNLGVVPSTIRQYSQILEEVGLIVIGNAGSYSKTVNGEIKYAQASNTYALASNPAAAREINNSMRDHSKIMASYGYKRHGSTQRTKAGGTDNEI